MKQIKTIVKLMDEADAFDAEVNRAIEYGWKLLCRKVIVPHGVGRASSIYAELEREELSPDVKKIFDYIEEAISRPHGDSFWIDEKGHRETVDVCDAVGWWCELMKPELLRVMPGITTKGELKT